MTEKKKGEDERGEVVRCSERVSRAERQRDLATAAREAAEEVRLAAEKACDHAQRAAWVAADAVQAAQRELDAAIKRAASAS